MKFVSYNIQYSKGKDGEFELERIVDELKGADVIALQEVVRNVPTVPDKDQPAGLGEFLADYYWVYGSTVDLDASEREDSGRIVNRRLQFGNMLLSRYKILSSRLLLLPRVRTYEKSSAQRGALKGLIDLPSGASVDVPDPVQDGLCWPTPRASDRNVSPPPRPNEATEEHAHTRRDRTHPHPHQSARDAHTHTRPGPQPGWVDQYVCPLGWRGDGSRLR